MKKLASILLIISTLLLTLASCTPPSDSKGEGDSDSEASEYADSRDVSGRNIAYATIKFKGYGDVKLLLDATSAPRTVANFLTLAKRGFYNGLTLYSAQKIDNSTLIMGGEPTLCGREPADEAIFGEFAANGYENDISHKRGTISMFHPSTNPDGADSVFFITAGDVTDVDGYYAPFGYVVSGLSVVDAMAKDGLDYTEPTGLITKNRQPVIESVSIDKDIDYRLILNVYVAPPTAAELASLSSSAAEFERIASSFAPASVKRAYESDYGYALQVTHTADSKLTNLLVATDKNGKILSTRLLSGSDTAEEFSAPLSSVAGKELSELENMGELPAELCSYLSDALRTVKAINSDGEASKYVYTRDTDGRRISYVTLKVKGYDEPIVILIDETTAPITAENFLTLVEDGFYDGLNFHRIIKNFMIQGGSDSHLPADKQTESIEGEFASNGHENDIKHLRGTISMARANDPNSASSGFFICDYDSPP